MTNFGLEMLRASLSTYNRAEAQLAIAEIALSAGDAKAGFAALQAIEPSLSMLEGLLTVYSPFLKGHLLAMSGAGADVQEAEALFRSCLEYARKWQWKLPELHTATGLAGLLARTGRRDEARAILTDTYNWFTEGFDTAPLRNAKALLDDLSQ